VKIAERRLLQRDTPAANSASLSPKNGDDVGAEHARHDAGISDATSRTRALSYSRHAPQERRGAICTGTEMRAQYALRATNLGRRG
jgi:hypothetical protein